MRSRDQSTDSNRFKELERWLLFLRNQVQHQAPTLVAHNHLNFIFRDPTPSSGQCRQYLHGAEKHTLHTVKKLTFNLQNQSFISPSVTSTKLPPLTLRAVYLYFTQPSQTQMHMNIRIQFWAFLSLSLSFLQSTLHTAYNLEQPSKIKQTVRSYILHKV